MQLVEAKGSDSFPESFPSRFETTLRVRPRSRNQGWCQPEENRVSAGNDGERGTWARPLSVTRETCSSSLRVPDPYSDLSRQICVGGFGALQCAN